MQIEIEAGAARAPLQGFQFLTPFLSHLGLARADNGYTAPPPKLIATCQSGYLLANLSACRRRPTATSMSTRLVSANVDSSGTALTLKASE